MTQFQQKSKGKDTQVIIIIMSVNGKYFLLLIIKQNLDQTYANMNLSSVITLPLKIVKSSS